MNAASPGCDRGVPAQPESIPAQEAYIEALSEAMREEYEAIVNAGLILQIDCARPRHGPRILLPGRGRCGIPEECRPAGRGAEQR